MPSGRFEWLTSFENIPEIDFQFDLNHTNKKNHSFLEPILFFEVKAEDIQKDFVLNEIIKLPGTRSIVMQYCSSAVVI
ncbi:MAG: hypothetical protein D8M61_13125 [Ignavibacteriae bacterium]|nr:hypothetical protein [Ignavibacteriota bacterium]